MAAGLSSQDADALAGLDLEALDPTPDIHALYAHYNRLYFNDSLGACSVEWSTKRMTLCAGQCHFSRGGGCRIKLSEPLLKYRPARDLKDTLLHEMIHAQLFLGNVRDDGDHGTAFKAVMRRINAATCPDPQRPAGGYNITVFHTMHDEVNSYRTHAWQCSGCGNTVRRAMNRPPQEADCRSFTKAAAAASGGRGGGYCRDARCWYHGHLRTCGGSYVKISEPDKPAATGNSSGAGQAAAAAAGGSGKRNKKQPSRAAAAAAEGSRRITSFFQARHQQPGAAGGQQQPQEQQQQQPAPPADPRAAAAAAAIARAAGSGQPAAAVAAREVVELLSSDDEAEQAGDAAAAAGSRRPAAGSDAAAAAGATGTPSPHTREALACPVCCLEFAQLAALNAHLDDSSCLA